jgi:hypothetical protein
MRRAKRLLGTLAEIALLNILLTGSGIGLLTVWARFCGRMKRRGRS